MQVHFEIWRRFTSQKIRIEVLSNEASCFNDPLLVYLEEDINAAVSVSPFINFNYLCIYIFIHLFYLYLYL